MRLEKVDLMFYQIDYFAHILNIVTLKSEKKSQMASVSPDCYEHIDMVFIVVRQIFLCRRRCL